MATMIPASSIAATLSADLTYNPSIHVQTVEIDRTGTSLAEMTENNFVKWYITLKDFQNLTWNIRDMPHYDAAASHSDVSDSIFAFARSADHVYAADPYAVGDFSGASGAEWAEEGAGAGQGSGVVLTQEASGGCVKFRNAHLDLSIPLQTDTPTYGALAGDGTEAFVGNTTVTYDRVLLDESASGSIAASTRTEASSTTTTWGFGTAASAQTSFAMRVNWIASQSNQESGASDYSTDFSYANGPAGVDYVGMDHWGTNTIHVYPSGVQDIQVYKPYNDAAADFIQIGMSTDSTHFVSGVGTDSSVTTGGLGLGTTTHGVAAGDSTSGHNSGDTDPGLVDPLDPVNGGMDAGAADSTTDSADFGAYFSDYTANHTAGDLNQRRNLIEVHIGKPTLKVSQSAFTKALQQAIQDHAASNVRDVSNTQSLRYAVKEAFEDNKLRGFQCGVAREAADDQNQNRTGAIELSLPLTVAGQHRYASAGDNEDADATTVNSADAAGTHKKVYLTPVIELVADGYYHPSWYTYTAVA